VTGEFLPHKYHGASNVPEYGLREGVRIRRLREALRHSRSTVGCALFLEPAWRYNDAVISMNYLAAASTLTGFSGAETPAQCGLIHNRWIG
jgi:hypothetical protein